MQPGPILDTSAWPALGIAERNSYRVSDTVVDMRRPELRTRPIYVSALPQSLLLDGTRTALIVIDMVNDFCAPDGWIASLGVDVTPARALIEPINRVSYAMRAHGMPVIWLNWGVRPDRLNLSPGTQHPFNPNGKGPGLSGEMSGAKRSHHVLRAESWGTQIVDELKQDGGDIHVDKHRISGFWDSPLDSILRNLGITTIIFTGVNADHCVMGTLMDANFHGYDTILIEDCTATTSPDFCLQATFHNVRFCFGFTLTSDSLCDGLTQAEPAS